MEVVTSETSGGVVRNTAMAGSTLPDILDYIETNIVTWTEMDVIWQVDALDLAKTTSDDVKWFVDRGEEMTKARAGRKTAIVAKGDFNFGMMRMLASLAEGRFHIAMAVFRDVPSAVHWIEEPPARGDDGGAA